MITCHQLFYASYFVEIKSNKSFKKCAQRIFKDDRTEIKMIELITFIKAIEPMAVDRHKA